MSKEMIHEVQTICDHRHAVKDSSVKAVILEVNDKWNALVRLFEQDKEIVVKLKKDYILHFFEKHIPELKEIK